MAYAQSMDGRIATITGDSQWISGDATLELAHRLRNEHDGILVGIGTVLADDPQLTCRIPAGRNPHRFVLDSTLRTPLGSHVAAQAHDVQTTVFCDADVHSPAVEGRRAELVRRGVSVRTAPREGAGLDLGAILEQMRAIGIDSLLVEGGAGLLTALYAARLVDRVVLVSAPVIIGTGTEAVAELGIERLADAWRGTTRSVRQAGDDIVWEIDFVHER